MRKEAKEKEKKQKKAERAAAKQAAKAKREAQKGEVRACAWAEACVEGARLSCQVVPSTV